MRLDPEPGTVIADRYRLVKVLGAGGAGRVWLAQDLELRDMFVALKEVRLPFAPSEALYRRHLERSQREARNAQKLRDHPNIVTVHDFLIVHEVPWIVMQFIGGRSLHDTLADGPLPVGTVKRIAAALLDALEAAHDEKIVHRDVKPANIMFAEDGAVLLTDFGIAHFQPDNGLTTTGVIIGSAEYIAPERARGEEGGPESDLFSLGVTLYHALEGVSPFRRDSPLGSLHAVVGDEAPPPRRAEWMGPLITQLMAKNPADRPTLAKARGLLNEPTTVVLPPSAPTAVMPKPTPGSSPRSAPAARSKPKPKKVTPNQNQSMAAAVLVLALIAGVVALYHGNRGFATYVTDSFGLSDDATSAQEGDCLHQDPKRGWVKVPCFSASADRKVLGQTSAAAPGDPCTAVTGWDSLTDSAIQAGPAGQQVQLCTAPLDQNTGQGPTPSPDPTTPTTPTAPTTPTSDTPYTPFTYAPPSYSTPTPHFDPHSLDNAQADQTPLASDALLPKSFTDSKGVVYTMTSGGLQSCLTSHESQDVQTVLRNGSCTNQVVGTYTDSQAHILVDVLVEPMADTPTATAGHNTLTSATSDAWGIWCPRTGAGSKLCDDNVNTSRATQSGYITNHHRYLIHSWAFYISLTTDGSVEPWTDAAASAAVDAAGPQNYQGNQY